MIDHLAGKTNTDSLYIITREPQITSFDAREILRSLKDSSQFPADMIDAGRRYSILEAIDRSLYDADTRHLIRAVSAKGFIPYYEKQYAKMYAQVFGFEKQGLLQAQIDSNLLAEALVSNMYAAADHVYWAFASLIDDVLNLLVSDNYGTLITIDGILYVLNSYATKILKLEKNILGDKKIMQNWEMKVLFSGGMNFEVEVPDRSYRNNPHWTGFNDHFSEQCQRVSYTANQLGIKRYSKYRRLDLLISRLCVYCECSGKRK